MGYTDHEVNHRGHIFSAMAENPQLQFPFLALVVSGGHTAIYKVLDTGDYTLPWTDQMTLPEKHLTKWKTAGI